MFRVGFINMHWPLAEKEPCGSKAMSKQAPDFSGLKPMDIKFIRSYVANGGNATEAAKDAGCKCKTEESFQTRGSQLKAKLDGPIRELMTHAGLTSLDILRTLVEGLGAKRANVHWDQDNEAHVHESPDWQARLRATDMAIKLQGGYPKAQMELPFAVDGQGRLIITAEFDSAGATEASFE